MTLSEPKGTQIVSCPRMLRHVGCRGSNPHLLLGGQQLFLLSHSHFNGQWSMGSQVITLNNITNNFLYETGRLLFWDWKQQTSSHRFAPYLHIYVYHYDSSGHITMGLCLSGSFFLLSFCLLSPLCCTSLLQQKSVSVVWRSDERGLCFFRRCQYNYQPFGSLGL